MPENNRQKFFIDWVLDNSQKDNGFSAKMRRADNPDQEYYALGILCGVNFHSKCKILGGVAEFFSKVFLCRFPPENFPRPVVYPVHSLPV